MSCAYRNAAGEAMYYAGYQQVDWDTAEPCGFAATKDNAMKDAQGMYQCQRALLTAMSRQLGGINCQIC